MAVTLVTAAVGYIFQQNWLAALSMALIALPITGVIVYAAIEYFIYRKIKLIYKTIYNLKSGRSTSFMDSLKVTNPFTEVDNEVLNWAQGKVTEIENLRRLEEYRKEFLGNVSHELKTPIFNLQGYIHSLLDGAIDEEGTNVYFLQKAAKSADRLEALVRDLLDITQIESGRLAPQYEVFDLYDLVNDIFESLDLKAKERNIKLQFKDSIRNGFFVEADKKSIRAVFVNLIVNSIKYGRNGGHTLIGFYDMHDNILVEVNDNGEGIAPEHLSRLFERFYRVDKSRSRDEGGTGLGLSIVKHIIEAHEQTLNVRSTEGIGSTFGFTLRRARERRVGFGL